MFRRALPLLAVSLVNKVASVGVSLLPVLVVERALPPGEAAFVLGAARAAAVLGTVGGGLLADRFGGNVALLVSFGTAAAGVAGMAVPGDTSAAGDHGGRRERQRRDVSRREPAPPRGRRPRRGAEGGGVLAPDGGDPRPRGELHDLRAAGGRAARAAAPPRRDGVGRGARAGRSVAPGAGAGGGGPGGRSRPVAHVPRDDAARRVLERRLRGVPHRGCSRPPHHVRPGRRPGLLGRDGREHGRVHRARRGGDPRDRAAGPHGSGAASRCCWWARWWAPAATPWARWSG